MKKHLPVVVINLLAVAAALFSFHLWRADRKPPGVDFRIEGTVAQYFYEEVDDMGYLPRPGRQVTARKFVGDQRLYDVVYTIGPDSFRVSQRPAGARSCVLHFGDSNTFGEGVNDNENYVWQLTDVSNGSIGTHNFGISGYGPHHALGGLQSGRIARAVTCKPTHAVFFFIPEHVGRIAGRAPWDAHGPRYALKDGKLIREGNFDSAGLPARAVPDLDEGILGWRRLIGIDALGTKEDGELAAAVMIEIAREIDRQWPGTKLHVVYWKIFNSRRMDEIAARLTTAGIVLHQPDAIIPGYTGQWQKWVLSPLDRHPNPPAHRRIAIYIAHEIVGEKR